MAKKKRGLLKFLDNLTPSKSNPNICKGTARKKKSSKKKKSIF